MRIDRIKLITELAKQEMTQKRLAELSGVSRTKLIRERRKLLQEESDSKK